MSSVSEERPDFTGLVTYRPITFRFLFPHNIIRPVVVVVVVHWVDEYEYIRTIQFKLN